MTTRLKLIKLTIGAILATSMSGIWAHALPLPDIYGWEYLVEESIQNHFDDRGRQVDLTRLHIEPEIEIEGDVRIVSSTVWAEQRMIAPYWGWHRCTTELKEVEEETFLVDRGSDCYFDFD